MAATLLQFATDQEAARLTALKDAKKAQDAAAVDDKAAEDARAKAAKDAQDAGAALDAVRKELAVPEKTPAEVAALSLQLKATTVAWRSALDVLAAQELARARVGVRFESARTSAANAAKAHNASVAALAAARATDKRQRAIIDEALVQSPLKDVPAQAAAALASADHTAAKARIDAALPKALRERARERALQAAAASAASAQRLAGAQDGFDTQAEASNPDAELVALQRDYDAADAALNTYASAATVRLSSAMATLKRLAALKNDPLTAAQKANLNDLQGTARPDAAVLQKERDDAAVVLANAAAVYKAESMKALASRPDGVLATMETDAATFPDLAKAKGDFDNAAADHAPKKLAFDAANAQRLSEWQAEVPDALWSEAATFFAAEDTLTDLKAAPAPLVTALDDARDLLIAALEEAAERKQRLDYAAATLAAERSLAEAVNKRASERNALALRGALAIDALLAP